MSLSIDELSREELLAMVKQLRTQRKFGLVWEDKTEEVAELCQQKLPVLTEITERYIPRRKKDGTLIPDDGSNLPPHLIIEGDNYHALSVLNYTHAGKIDVIYIDPPYNTGNRDFIYNDRYIDKEDGYRHSKWLSFMEKRLVLAKNLLTDSGVIFISIDDNEQAHLRLLCDEIFGAENFIATLPVIMNLKGNNDEFGFAGTHEYALVYGTNKSIVKIREFNINEEEIVSEWQEDEHGLYKKGACLKRTGVDAPRHRRPTLFFPVFVDKNGGFYTTDDDQPKHPTDKTILPITNGQEMSWRWSKNKINSESFNLILNKDTIYKKQRPQLGDLPTKKPKSIFYKPEYSSGNGTALLKAMFGEKIFQNPKPLDLIKDFLYLTVHRSAKILDFFAGSGTTGHAVLELNAADGGNRQFILCTNNENGIAKNITYPRIKKVIEGYGGKKPILAEVRYFKTDFVEKECPPRITDEDRINFTAHAGTMIAVKENCFNLVEHNKTWQIFENHEKWVAIYFQESKSQMPKLLKKIGDRPCVLYIFSWEPNEYTHEYTTDTIEVKDIPAPILGLYQRTHGRKK